MHTKNFPGKIAKRLENALNRLKVQNIGANSKFLRLHPDSSGEEIQNYIEKRKKTIENEQKVLKNRWNSMISPISIKTKKNRSALAKI